MKLYSHLQIFLFIPHEANFCDLSKGSKLKIKILTRSIKVSEYPNQSILKEINPEYSLERLMLKLKFQYFGYLKLRADSLEKTLMLEKIEGRRRRGCQRMRWLDGITDSMDMRKDREA